MHLKAFRPRLWPACLVVAALLAPGAMFAAEKPRLRVDDYQIQAEIQPVKHELTAQARVKFTALEDLSVAVFELNNALRPTRVSDPEGHTLQVERVTQDSTIRVTLPSGLAKDSSTTLTFEYTGTLENGDQSPVPGLKLAYVGSEETYLLLRRPLVPGQRLWRQPIYFNDPPHGAGFHDRGRQRQCHCNCRRGSELARPSRAARASAHKPGLKLVPKNGPSPPGR